MGSCGVVEDREVMTEGLEFGVLIKRRKKVRTR
jgi:hypothetical protein